jgi:DNA-binding response OmpR family regulator
MTMNVLYVTGHLSDVDFIEHELGKIAPEIRIDVSPTYDDVLARVAIPGRYDAVLIDPVLPGGEGLRLIARIQERKLPLAVVVMTGPAAGNPPVQVLEAGADDYVVKRPHFVDSIPWILERAVERRRMAAEVCTYKNSESAGSGITQEPARRALEDALRAAEARERKEPFTELATAAVQALAELAMPIGDCGSVLMECLDKDDPRRTRAVRLMEIARQAGKLARQLLALRSRQEALDLNLMVAQIAGKLRSLAGENVKLLTILSPRLPHVLAAPPLTEQLLTALVAFARDLLPVGGTITLEMAQRAPDAAPEPEQCVLLAVTASGYSVQPHAETSVLDPFVAACGGSLSSAGDAETGVTIEVSLPAECQFAVP